MPQIEWSGSFNTNVKSIDSQHKKLIQIMNELGKAMSSGYGREAIGETIAALFDYTKYHFEMEEKKMDEYNYPDAPGHKKAHYDFIGKIGQLEEKVKSGGFAITIETMHFISRWIQDHIMVKDKEFGRFLNGMGVE